MFIKQISVFIANRQGRLEEFTTLLGENQIDLFALSVADTADYGMLRAIVADYDKAAKLLQSHNYSVDLTDVLAVAVPDSPGGLANVLQLLSRAEVSIEYLYSFVRRIDQNAVIIFRVDQPVAAAKLLANSGVRLLAQDEITSK